MFEYDFENEDKELKLVGLELMFLTPEKYSNPEGITAVELDLNEPHYYMEIRKVMP